MSAADMPHLWWSPSRGQVITPAGPNYPGEYRTVSEGDVVVPLPDDAVEFLPAATVRSAIAAVLRESLGELADAVEKGASS